MTQKRKVTVNRKHKDSLFRIIFKDKKELLSLYNALAGTQYRDTDDLTITTKEDIIYMSMKNDVSFIVDDYLNLYEHQSSFNPNMPLRGLLYIADLYKPLLKESELYASRLIKIPNPKYVVFYNGEKESPDKVDLKLSDAFFHEQGDGDVEIIAHMLNINYGHNRELMEKCEKLKEYAVFIAMIRKNLAIGNTLEMAVQLAMDECIRQKILEDIIRKERAIIMDSILTEFDEKAYAAMVRQEGYVESKIEDILELLKELGSIPEDLQKTIQKEVDLLKLKEWHIASAKAESIEQFRLKTGI